METKAEVWLPLSQGNVAVIDFEDYEKVRGVKWSAIRKGAVFYACRNIWGAKQKNIYLHRVITNCPPGLQINHINGDGLDNRRENLQICTQQQNLSAHHHKRKNASSRYRGVYWYKQTECWHAQIKHNYKSLHLGYFDSEEAAARAYDDKARELLGEYACPNFPKEVSNAA